MGDFWRFIKISILVVLVLVVLAGALVGGWAYLQLRPKDDAAREALADGFAKTWRAAGMARSTLVGSAGDEHAFSARPSPSPPPWSRPWWRSPTACSASAPRSAS